ncbi:MAG: hypothetical protein ACQEW9_18325 [Bacteroidota bacterium]
MKLQFKEQLFQIMATKTAINLFQENLYKPKAFFKNIEIVPNSTFKTGEQTYFQITIPARHLESNRVSTVVKMHLFNTLEGSIPFGNGAGIGARDGVGIIPEQIQDQVDEMKITGALTPSFF